MRKRIGYFAVVVSIISSITALHWATQTTISELSPEFRASYTEGVRIGLNEAKIEIYDVESLSQKIMNKLSIWDNVRLTIFQSEKVGLEVGIILLEHIQEERTKKRLGLI